MGLCCGHRFDYGGVYLVHRSNDFLEVCCSLSAVSRVRTRLTLSFRTKFRRDANKADNKSATLAVDALINFEAVKVR